MRAATRSSRSRPRAATVALALVAAAAAGVVASREESEAAGACDARSVVRAHGDRSRAVRAPLIVGDSTMLLAAPYLAARGIEADARGCRPLVAGVSLLAARKRARTLPGVAVLALGSNGAIGRGQIGRALRIVGRKRILGLVTPARVGSGSAREMRIAARRYPDRVVLIDWMRYSRRRGGIFAGDGLHVGHDGARVFAAFVRRRLDPFFAPPLLHADAPADGGRPCGRARALDVLVIRGTARVSCARARDLARSRALRGIAGWRYYDWRRSGRRPWSAVYVRDDRKVIVVTRRTSP